MTNHFLKKGLFAAAVTSFNRTNGDSAVWQGSAGCTGQPTGWRKSLQKRRQMETINIYHRHVLVALCPVSKRTNREPGRRWKGILTGEILIMTWALFFFSPVLSSCAVICHCTDLKNLGCLRKEIWYDNRPFLPLQRPHARTGLDRLMFVYITLPRKLEKKCKTLRNCFIYFLTTLDVFSWPANISFTTYI